MGFLGFDASLLPFAEMSRREFDTSTILFETRENCAKFRKNAEIFRVFPEILDIHGDLFRKLSKIDVLINAFPDKTQKKLLSSREFFEMKSNSLLLDLGFLRNIDQFAIIEALSLQRIAGAWLDLPISCEIDSKNPLFSVKNLCISLENINSSCNFIDSALEEFRKNYNKFCEGELHKITGKIDKEMKRFIDFS